MNPLIKMLLKQLEENTAAIEKVAKVSERYDHWETKMNVNGAFDHLHSSIRVIKRLVEELI